MGPLLLRAVEILLVMQATQATVFGVVRDGKTGEPLAGAGVWLTDLNRATATGADGRYVLRHVPAGPQHLTIRFLGHAERALHALVPPDGQLEINVSLDPAPIRLRIIEVRPSVIVRGVDAGDSTSFPDRGASIAAVRNHPLLAEPDVFQALGGGEVVLRPESPSGVHIRGGGSDHTAYLLDGIPVFSPYHAAGVFSAWNPDAIDRLHLSSTAPSPSYPDALSGAVEAVTRAPGADLRAQGSFSTTQARLTVDGPLGVGGVGYLVSLRSGFPSGFTPKHEASFLKGETGDRLAKLEGPALGGRARLLGYDSENEINTAAAANIDSGRGADSRRNVFEWRSRSLGGEWRRDFPGMALRVLAWSAHGHAGSAWSPDGVGIVMAAARRDEGLLASVERSSAGATTVAGIRVQRSRTSYRLESDSAGGPSWGLSARTPVAAVFGQHAKEISRRMNLELGASLAVAARDLHLAPRARLRWKPWAQVTVVGSYARLHQFAQSLRNSESVVGNVFPVDLYMGAGASGVPVARSDQRVIAAEYLPLAGVRLGVQAYERDFTGLLLAAPRDGEPFTTGAFATGTGTSRGVSVDAAVSTARYGILASYGLQRVRLEHGESSYVPDHGATHLLEGGMIVFPTATSSIRLGATGTLSRRTTTVSGGFEWEACNLLDEGCEFGGSPRYGAESLGATALPAYVRIDLGVRKHWHVTLGGRQALIALFGTVTNIFDRSNVLTYSRDPVTGELAAIEMRPVAPLVVGLDWRF